MPRKASIPTSIEFQEHIDPHCLPVKVNATQIHQVVMNLCTNAYQAMHDKGGVLEVRLEMVELGGADLRRVGDLPEGAYLRLSVRDTGSGIDAETMKKIFEPFFTTKEAGEGTGLGLSVVHGIVFDHGGGITVDSTPGIGTTFDVYLPMVQVEVEQAAAPVETVQGGTEAVLFIDDEVQIAHLAKEMLEPLGYSVTVRTSAVEALELFKNDPDRFAVVITDQTMPQMTGAELAGRLLELRPDLPIILATGFSETISEKKCEQMGVQAFLRKPILTRELALTLRKVLERRNAPVPV